MQPLVMITILALLGEVVIEVLKPLLAPMLAPLAKYEKVDPYLYISTALGVLFALLYRADLLLAIGLPEQAGLAIYVGQVLTGLMLGRGANFVHDVIAKIAQ